MENSERKIIILAVAAGALFVVAMSAAAVVVVQRGGGGGAGDIGALMRDEYVPTSEWLEEGVDPEVTTFGFESGSAPAEQGGRELTEYEIQQLINSRQNSLMHCYADALADNPDLQGRVDMRFGIASDGHLSLVKVTGSTLRDKPTEDCLVASAREWRFPHTNRSGLMKFETDFSFVYE